MQKFLDLIEIDKKFPFKFPPKNTLCCKFTLKNIVTAANETKTI